jgi:hypothetical protein
VAAAEAEEAAEAAVAAVVAEAAVAASAAAEDLAAAIVRVHKGGHRLRESTLDWFKQRAISLSLDASLAQVGATYARTST